ncbi:protein of unknown function [Xenorhabdus nematophila AN6/1]|nr:hypothetical protein XNA1_1200016 [Xenorhabdus nematophila str. Anatoliense]CEF30716.1 hypothetical protein XNW1_2810023 [Xenorhabdus nematophila str. Websteri]CEF34311.1 hypothetical protein XNW1_940022 [Xenorhabdus nematophila str. Websteri]CEK23594.1 protein of unknown function [Xenorhabdus nematophila AN6/1]
MHYPITYFQKSCIQEWLFHLEFIIFILRYHLNIMRREPLSPRYQFS